MIKQFKKEYDFLSNFYLCKVDYCGLIFPSAEHAYQSEKVDIYDPLHDEWISKCRNSKITCGIIKKLSRLVTLREDWDEIKLEIMLGVLRSKFIYNKDLGEKLLETGKEEIQEGNNWNDVFWGVDLHTGYGENWLGKLLMEVRTELK